PRTRTCCWHRTETWAARPRWSWWRAGSWTRVPTPWRPATGSSLRRWRRFRSKPLASVALRSGLRWAHRAERLDGVDAEGKPFGFRSVYLDHEREAAGPFEGT